MWPILLAPSQTAAGPRREANNAGISAGDPGNTSPGQLSPKVSVWETGAMWDYYFKLKIDNISLSFVAIVCTHTIYEMKDNNSDHISKNMIGFVFLKIRF